MIRPTWLRRDLEAMMKGEGDVVTGWKNKFQSSLALVTPSEMLARQHRKMAEPGTAKAETAAAE